MDDNSIFDQTNDDNSNTEIQSHYDLLVGEGKKFKDNEALARGKIESDRFIEKVLREQHELRKELDSRLSMEELVQKLGKTASTPGTPSGLESPSIPTPNVMPTKADVDPNEIASIVKNTMTQEYTKLQQEKNIKSVAAELKKAWGDNWVGRLREVGNQLDLTEAQMDTLAKTAPKALLSSVLKETSKVDNTKFVAPKSSITSIPQPQDGNGWSWYEKLRKESPREYYSQRVQMQLHKDVQSGKVVLPSE